jgi:hypothetical protein
VNHYLLSNSARNHFCPPSWVANYLFLRLIIHGACPNEIEQRQHTANSTVQPGRTTKAVRTERERAVSAISLPKRSKHLSCRWKSLPCRWKRRFLWISNGMIVQLLWDTDLDEMENFLFCEREIIHLGNSMRQCYVIYQT